MQKRLILFILSITLLLTACSGCKSEDSIVPTTEPPMTFNLPDLVSDTLQVGFGRADITPKESVPLRGYGNTSKRLSISVSDPLYATCIAFTDANNNTILLYHTDLAVIWAEIFDPIKESISKATGVPVSNIMISATHTHSAPDLVNDQIRTVAPYVESLNGLLVQAATDAMADRKVADMFVTSTVTEGINFARHYKLADGSFKDYNNSRKNKESIVDYQCEADAEMQFVKFVREGAKDIWLVNYQTHPHRAGGSQETNITADIVGTMRIAMERELDCNFAYFSGASGNVNPWSLIDANEVTTDYIEQGELMAKYAIEADSTFKQVPVGSVQILGTVYKGKTQDGTGTPPDAPIYAFSIGDVGFVAAPYEMFNANGMFIKENSPFETTFVVTCANARLSYIPSQDAHSYDGVPTYEGASCRFANGTGEILADKYVEMLKLLYEARD